MFLVVLVFCASESGPAHAMIPLIPARAKEGQKHSYSKATQGDSLLCCTTYLSPRAALNELLNPGAGSDTMFLK